MKITPWKLPLKNGVWKNYFPIGKVTFSGAILKPWGGRCLVPLQLLVYQTPGAIPARVVKGSFSFQGEGNGDVERRSNLSPKSLGILAHRTSDDVHARGVYNHLRNGRYLRFHAPILSFDEPGSLGNSSIVSNVDSSQVTPTSTLRHFM